MQCVTSLFIVIICVVPESYAVLIGSIFNAAYTPVNVSAIIAYSNSCSECVCKGLLLGVSPPYVALNCYRNNKTCVLFTNYSAASLVRASSNSTFIFRTLPPTQNTTGGPFPLAGELVAGRADGLPGSASNALMYPWGLALDTNGSLYVSDSGNARVMKYAAGSPNGSQVAGSTFFGTSNSQLDYPSELSVDASGNVFVNDNLNYRVMWWRRNTTSGLRVAGISFPGVLMSTFGRSAGLAVDSQQNIYLSDTDNQRIMRWAANATSGTVVAGFTAVPGSSNSRLNMPYGLYLDENNSSLYIADSYNQRIQRYQLGDASAGVTVAGGNGYGPASNQLDQPSSICVSKRTGDIYIADSGNQRIQRWSPGATSGVTIVGITGVRSSNLSLLDTPSSVILNADETYLYVSDTNNHRVQRFRLP